MYVVVKGARDQLVFPNDEAKLTYLAWLRSAASQYRLVVHAYVLLPNEFHCLVTSPDETALSRTMQSLGRRYTQYFHKVNQNGAKTSFGSIWEGRYRSAPVDPQSYFLIVQRYIESLPLEKGLVSKLEDYSLSSYKIHIGKEPNYALNDGASFWNLGNTPFERQMNWRAFVDEGNTGLDKEVIANSLNSQRFIGNEDFILGGQVFAKAAPKKRGRPKKVQNAPTLSLIK
jgi:putative transposase